MKRTFAALLLVSLAPACIFVVSGEGVDVWHGERSRGPARSEVRTLDAVHGLALRSSASVRVRAGETQSLIVTAAEDVLPFVRTEVREGVLVVEQASGAPSSRRGVEVQLTVPCLDAIAIEGSGDVHATGLAGPALRVSISGSGDVVAAGAVESVDVSVGGSGDARLADLVAKTAHVDVAGSGDVHVAASDALEVEIAGSGDVRYRGSPRVTQTVHGSGDVRRD